MNMSMMIYILRKFRLLFLSIVSLLMACNKIDSPIGIPYPSDIIIDDPIITDTLYFANDRSEMPIQFKTNNTWTVSFVDNTVGVPWYAVSTTSGSEGDATVTLYISENLSCDSRSVRVLIQSGTAAKSFTILQYAKNTKTINILCFGNSFTEDSMGYVPAIMKNIAPDVNLTIGIAFISGSPLTQHCAYITDTTRTDRFHTYSVQGGKYYKDGNVVSYTYIKSSCAIDNGKWLVVGGKSINEMLSDEKWDIITFQQAGTSSDGAWLEWYEPYIYDLRKALFAKITHNIKIGWLIVHSAYESTDEGFLKHWQGTVENSEKVMTYTAADVLFPYGTAIQNLRTTPLILLGNGSAHNLTYDNAHLQEGIGCLAAAYTNALTIVNELGLNKIGVIGDSFRPSVKFIESNNIPSPHWLIEGQKNVIGISDENCYYAQIAAEKAIINPYVCSKVDFNLL